MHHDMITPRLRLVQVLVQPVYLLDDGDTLLAVDSPQPIVVSVAEWTGAPSYPERFAAVVEEHERWAHAGIVVSALMAVPFLPANADMPAMSLT